MRFVWLFVVGFVCSSTITVSAEPAEQLLGRWDITMQSADAEVPSPTYTLLNAYDAGAIEILHGDLYRLGVAEEIAELGLDEAVDQTIILLEWPDRWPSPPARRLCLSITTTGCGQERKVSFTPRGGGWAAVGQVLRGLA